MLNAGFSADLASGSDTEVRSANLVRFCLHGSDRFAAAIRFQWCIPCRLANVVHKPDNVRRHGIVILAMGLDRGGLPVVDTRLWGGLLVTLVVAVTGIVASIPIGIALALGRRSSLPLIRLFSIAFIEFWRGVPLITVLFFATYMLPLFLPGNFTVDGLVRVLIGIALFAGAYNAEVFAAARGDPERAGGSRQCAGPVLLEDDRADRDAAGGASRYSRIGQQFHRLVQGYLAGLDRRVVRSAGSLRASFSDPSWATPTTLLPGLHLPD